MAEVKKNDCPNFLFQDQTLLDPTYHSCGFDQKLCDTKHGMLQWILTSGLGVLVVVLGFYYTKLDKVQDSTTQTLVNVQKINDKLDQARFDLEKENKEVPVWVANK